MFRPGIAELIVADGPLPGSRGVLLTSCSALRGAFDAGSVGEDEEVESDEDAGEEDGQEQQTACKSTF